MAKTTPSSGSCLLAAEEGAADARVRELERVKHDLAVRLVRQRVRRHAASRCAPSSSHAASASAAKRGLFVRRAGESGVQRKQKSVQKPVLRLCRLSLEGWAAETRRSSACACQAADCHPLAPRVSACRIHGRLLPPFFTSRQRPKEAAEAGGGKLACLRTGAYAHGGQHSRVRGQFQSLVSSPAVSGFKISGLGPLSPKRLGPTRSHFREADNLRLSRERTAVAASWQDGPHIEQAV